MKVFKAARLVQHLVLS